MILFSHGRKIFRDNYESLNNSFNYWKETQDPRWLIVWATPPQERLNLYSLDYFLTGQGVFMDVIVREAMGNATFEGDVPELPLIDRKFLYIMSMIKNEEKRDIYMGMWENLTYAKNNWTWEKGNLTDKGKILGKRYLNEFYLRNLYTMADFIECCSTLHEDNGDMAHFTPLQVYLNRDIIKIGIQWEYFNKLWIINDIYNDIKHKGKSIGCKVALASIRAYFEEYIRKICHTNFHDNDIRDIIVYDENLFPYNENREYLKKICMDLNRMLSSVQHCNVEVNEAYYKNCYRYFCELIAGIAETNVPEDHVRIYNNGKQEKDYHETGNNYHETEKSYIPCLPIYVCIDTSMGVSRNNELLDKYDSIIEKYKYIENDCNIEIINVSIGKEAQILKNKYNGFPILKSDNENQNSILEKTLFLVESNELKNRKEGDKQPQILIMSDGYFNDDTDALADKLIEMSNWCYIEAIMIGNGNNPHVFNKANEKAGKDIVNII